MSGSNVFPFRGEVVGSLTRRRWRTRHPIQAGCENRIRDADMPCVGMAKTIGKSEDLRGWETMDVAGAATTRRCLMRMEAWKRGLLGVGIVLSLVGCATPVSRTLPASQSGIGATKQSPARAERKQVPPPSDTPRTASQDKETPPVPGTISAPTQEPLSDAVPLVTGDYAILVESQPSGAMIVVNGIPVGRTPRKITLPGTPQGFSRGTVSIKARFVASSSAEQSATIEEEFTPLDRLPVGLLFTPEKAQRRW